MNLNVFALIVNNSYTKPKGQLPDYSSPVVLPTGHTAIEDFCNKLHRTIAKEFK
jgi:ribosome-interacting GTPase 1